MGEGLIDCVGPERSGAKAAGCRLRGMQQPVVRVRARVRVQVKVKVRVRVRGPECRRPALHALALGLPT